MDISQLTSDPDNAREHTDRNIEIIEKAIAKVGPARSILIDEDGVILAGNATREAAMRAGIKNVRIVKTDGRTLVVVRVSGLSDEDKKYLALADNRAPELGGWKAAQVHALYEQGLPLSDMWSGHEFVDLVRLGGESANLVDEDAEDFEQERFNVIACIWFGKQQLRLLPEEAARFKTVLDIWGDDYALLGEALASVGA